MAPERTTPNPTMSPFLFLNQRIVACLSGFRLSGERRAGLALPSFPRQGKPCPTHACGNRSSLRHHGRPNVGESSRPDGRLVEEPHLGLGQGVGEKNDVGGVGRARTPRGLVPRSGPRPPLGRSSSTSDAPIAGRSAGTSPAPGLTSGRTSRRPHLGDSSDRCRALARVERRGDRPPDRPREEDRNRDRRRDPDQRAHQGGRRGQRPDDVGDRRDVDRHHHHRPQAAPGVIVPSSWRSQSPGGVDRPVNQVRSDRVEQVANIRSHFRLTGQRIDHPAWRMLGRDFDTEASLRGVHSRKYQLTARVDHPIGCNHAEFSWPSLF